MEFSEFLFAISVSVVLPIVLLGQILRYRRWKLESKGRGGEQGLRVSELETMIRSAVERANAPLQRRIEQVEAIVTGPDDDLRLHEPVGRLALPEPDDEDLDAPPRFYGPPARSRA